MKPKYGYEQISKDKRLARGEHFRIADECLQIEGYCHPAQKKYRVMVMAGGAPQGEIDAIRTLWPKARITAVDSNPACIEVAKQSGVDEYYVCDLYNYQTLQNNSYGVKKGVVSCLSGKEFDILSLDLCGVVKPEYRELISIYQSW